MNSSTVVEIERSIRALPLEDQLWLAERIVRQVREKTQASARLSDVEDLEEQLTAMANDPTIRTELDEIERELAVTDMDGLERL
jgi:hypothetical protein